MASTSTNPTRREVLKQVRAMGLSCGYTYYGEYRVDFKRTDPRWSKETAYFTEDGQDAIATAIYMAAWLHLE